VKIRFQADADLKHGHGIVEFHFRGAAKPGQTAAADNSACGCGMAVDVSPRARILSSREIFLDDSTVLGIAQKSRNLGDKCRVQVAVRSRSE
jgi:hypothetical protein